MKYLADLHVHSLYSRATSKTSHLRGLAAWGAVKGIQVVATGDFTHPGWFAQLVDELQEAEPGFFQLRPKPLADYRALLPEAMRPAMQPEALRFLLSAEVSCIYRRGGKVRKVHHLLYAPSFEAARRINTVLASLGNISSDGRPILGLDSRHLLEIALESSPAAFLAPAHIWTPWFSLFGSKSGFDSIEECFGDLSEHIFALETGLSSDPAMNRHISALDRYSLISNSDCHSPAKLGREANCFNTDFDYFSLRQALIKPQDDAGGQRFVATVEFYPEEGKYHADGHRNCGVCLQPHASQQLTGLCPRCGGPLTIGVLHRVMQLADRNEPLFPPGSPATHSLIPLQELLAELMGQGANTKKTMDAYTRLINLFGAEFTLLLETPLEEVRPISPLLAEALARVRRNEVIRQPGYDGAFGRIHVFAEGERARLAGQGELFSSSRKKNSAGQKMSLQPLAAAIKLERPEATMRATQLNGEQQQAVNSESRLIVAQAGPGAGKTHTLVARVKAMQARSSTPCTVITFTNKAAAELAARLAPSPPNNPPPAIATFHGYCLAQLRRWRPALQVFGPEERLALLQEMQPKMSAKARQALSEQLSLYVQSAYAPEAIGKEAELIGQYLALLAARDLIDLDDLVAQTVALLQQHGPEAERMRREAGAVFIDEFQDVNEAQYKLVAEFARSNPLFIIGDPDQAIYGFRGSHPRWFYRFIDEFQPQYFALNHNYRNPTHILHAAQRLIAANPHPLGFTPMQARSADSGHLHLQGLENPEQEALFIVRQIEAHVGGTSHRSLEHLPESQISAASFGDIAILYRSNRQAEPLARALEAATIPFQTLSLRAYYMQGPCRLLYSWLLLLSGLGGYDDLLFLIHHEKALSTRRRVQLQALFRAAGAEDTRNAMDALFAAAPQHPDDAAIIPARLHQLWSWWREATNKEDLGALIEALIASYQLNPLEPEQQRFRAEALAFGDLRSYAAHLFRFSDSVIYDHRADTVTLSTLHAAKGLEFPIVFMSGCEDGLLPLHTPEDQGWRQAENDVEEERRLFYVGMTRAQQRLYCTWCASRRGHGRVKLEAKASPFLAAIDPKFVTPAPMPPVKTLRKQALTHKQLSLFSLSHE